MQTRGNLARKQQVVTNPSREVAKKQKRVINSKRNPRRYILANTMLVIGILGCAFLLVSAYSNLTVLSNQTATLTEDIAKLQGTEVALTAEVENMLNLGVVEEYAINVLEMSKVDKSQIEYVNIQNDDKIEIKKDNNVLSMFSNVENENVEYID